MATISTSIRLVDNISNVIRPILRSMNLMISGFENMATASGGAINTSAMAAARTQVAQAGAAFSQLEHNIDGAASAMGNFNDSVNSGGAALEQSIESAASEMDNFNDSVNSGSDATSGLMDNLKSVAITLGTIFAVDKIIDFGAAAIESAGAAKAITSQFEQTFGNLRVVAQKNIDSMASDFGMVPNRLKPAMSQMTSMFKGLGMDTESAMGKATTAVTMSADAAAFYDKSFADANSGLTSFIKGNYEGGEAIGIFANDTQLAAYAVSQGLVEATKDWSGLSEATKQATRLDYAQNMQQLAGATGQAARESDGLENQMGNVQQAWTDFLAIAGSPVLESVVDVLKNITAGLQSSDSDVSSLTNNLNKFGDIAGDAAMTLIKMSKQIMIAVAAFVAYNAVIAPSIAIGKSAVLTYQTITGAIAVMTTGATAATPAIASMAATLTFLTGPVGLATVALAALTAGIVALYIKKKTDVTMTKEQIAANDKFISSIDSTIESINSGVAAREQSLRSSELEIVAAKTLADQIFNLADKQNKSAYELSLLNGYVDQFNQVMPNANLLIDNQTGALNLSRDAVWEYIAAEQERIRIAAGAEMMIANKKAELEATMGLSAANAELTRLEAEKSAAAEAALAQGGTQVQMAQNVAKATEGYNAEIANTKARQDELTAALGLTQTEYDKINQMMADPSGFAAKEANEQAALAATTLYTGSSLEILEQYKQGAVTKITEASAGMGGAVQQGLFGIPKQSETAGQESTAGFIRGLLGNTTGIGEAGKINAQTLIDSTNAALDINSPSKVFQTTGNYVGDGLIQGLKDRESQIAAGGDAAATALKNSFKSALGINSPSTVFRDFGFYAIDGLIEGLSSTELMVFCESIVADMQAAFKAGNFNLQAGIEFLGSGAEEFFKSIGIGVIAKVGELLWPTASQDITSSFGWRTHPITGEQKFHEGIDIGAAFGDAVNAAAAGTVITAGYNGGWGNMVEIDHGGGLTTLYAHLSAINVAVGQIVAAGQKIGEVGSTGNSTGPHLHYGVYQDGVAIDPMTAALPAVSGDGSAAAGWIQQALSAAGIQASQAEFNHLMQLAWNESNYNPGAINDWDSNAMAGTPSMGFMQTIQSTFDAYSLGGSIWDPVANAVAAIRYMIDRYGSIMATPLDGYASGTNFATRGLHLVGENGPEILHFAGGEKVLDAKKSKELVNSAGSRKSSTGGAASPIFNINIKNDNTINNDMDIELVSKKIGKKIKDEILISASGLYEAV